MIPLENAIQLFHVSTMIVLRGKRNGPPPTESPLIQQERLSYHRYHELKGESSKTILDKLIECLLKSEERVERKNEKISELLLKIERLKVKFWLPIPLLLLTFV